MSRQTVARKLEVSTRDRILNAAVTRFSRYSYEETGLRDIAADVGVDVSYVHRCFGSKKQLFTEAVQAAIQPLHFPAGDTRTLARSVARQFLTREAARARGNVAPLDIIVRSLASPEASRVVRDFILKDFVNPLAERLGQVETDNVTLVVAFLAGVSILRNVLRVSPLLKAEPDEFETLIADAVEQMMKADPASQRKDASGRSRRSLR
ncbi:TetR/AcrR family transcriptional regulator [Bradyrhizobium liaoningense]